MTSPNAPVGPAGSIPGGFVVAGISADQDIFLAFNKKPIGNRYSDVCWGFWVPVCAFLVDTGENARRGVTHWTRM